MIVTLGRAINLLQTGLSVIPIGESKQPFIAWKKFQTEQIVKEDLEKHSSNPNLGVLALSQALISSSAWM